MPTYIKSNVDATVNVISEANKTFNQLITLMKTKS